MGPPHPGDTYRALTPDDQAVLRAAFVEGNRTPEAAAARLHLSRSTNYRKVRAALEALAEALDGL